VGLSESAPALLVSPLEAGYGSVPPLCSNLLSAIRVAMPMSKH
jgi:hypothetical protein